jgi:hypothetical protein
MELMTRPPATKIPMKVVISTAELLIAPSQLWDANRRSADIPFYQRPADPGGNRTRTGTNGAHHRHDE